MASLSLTAFSKNTRSKTLRKNVDRSKNSDCKPVRLVIADTGPVNYLILIGHINLLPRLFQRVILPTAVKEELHDIGAPVAVRAWIGSPPDWLEIVETPGPAPVMPGLDEG